MKGSRLAVACLCPPLLAAILSFFPRTSGFGEETSAQSLEKALAGLDGTAGLIVHVAPRGIDARKLAAIFGEESRAVHTLVPESDSHVALIRKQLRADGRYGRLTVDSHKEGDPLPFVDNMVNLLVIENPAAIDEEEITRVLAPHGAALLREDDGWRTIRKPWPESIDEWTHYLHGPSNNAVGDDTEVGPPRHYQWAGSPLYLRHHDHLSGFSAMVSARGRLYYIVDQGPRWSVQMPPKWTLVARDGFNGVVLWEKPIASWHPHLWSLKKGPAQLMRRLVARENEVFVTLGYEAPVSALNGATGEEIRTYPNTEGAEEMILDGGVLYVLVNPELDAYKSMPKDSVSALRGSSAHWNWDEKPRRILAFEAGSGKLLWERESRVAPCTLTADGGRLFYHDGDRVLALDPRTGQELWTSDPIPRWKPMHVLFGPSLVAAGEVVLFAGGENMDPLRGGKDNMTALDAATGKKLWTAPHPPSGYASSEDLLVIDGLVWSGETTSRNDSGIMTGRDLLTGEVKREFPPDDWQPHMSHHRCYRSKATRNYILTSRTGIEYVDIRNQTWDANHWVRGACNYGVLPCNGLTYAPPHSCACYLLAKLNGLNALAATQSPLPENSAENRLARGPAFDPETGAAPGDEDSWPTYRGNALRSGSTGGVVPPGLKLAWQAKIGEKLGSLVVGEGKVFTAAIDRHTVHAFDAASGEPAWTFTAGGRVDSPPSLWRGRVVFGSADGSIYCLRAADGELAWRYRAAPADRRMMSFEQMESVWPVSGSVLIRDGVVHAVAGRAMWLDGGLRLVRLDAATGGMLTETVLDDRYPGTSDNLQKDLTWPNLPTALPDVLSSDDKHLYMRSQPFDLEGKRLDVFTARYYGDQKGETAHLFSPTGFLDDSWWHRTYWIYGRSFIGGAGGWSLASLAAPAGRILSHDGDTIYGFGRAPRRYRGTENVYHLFACEKFPELVNPNPNKPPTKRGASIYGEVFDTFPRYQWSRAVPMLVRGMVATGDALFVAGPRSVVDEEAIYADYGNPEVQEQMLEQIAAFEGKKGGVLLAVSKTDGKKLAAWEIPSPPVFDGLAAAGGRLYLATTGGSVLCLAGDEGSALPAAPDVKPGPPPSSQGPATFAPTPSHPDFPHIEKMRITESDLGYRVEGPAREFGLALRKLEKPITGKATFTVKLRPVPGAASPDKPGNAFFAFGAEPDDAKLVKCGFRISGQRLYIINGPLLKTKGAAAVAEIRANVVTEMRVAVDLKSKIVSMSMNGVTFEAPLTIEMDQVNWAGYETTVTADFGPVEVSEK